MHHVCICFACVYIRGGERERETDRQTDLLRCHLELRLRSSPTAPDIARAVRKNTPGIRARTANLQGSCRQELSWALSRLPSVDIGAPESAMGSNSLTKLIRKNWGFEHLPIPTILTPPYVPLSRASSMVSARWYLRIIKKAFMGARPRRCKGKHPQARTAQL